ncbi:NEDD8 activating enzyme [Dacryopinax primogenitus]|uniref:NEDD8-activating enzyme E1 catalytic subunit n=1 Tax=Dacryopinax primogenitus (strain DJM 731) TaxID=1858805 RepID=M5G0J9_DACPD|nr:NEDD8 activating enzyme [Dacryopinax primogenitus]EJU02264.1 NEDD8 activating enzyme [Dacryopinax primogenitus]
MGDISLPTPLPAPTWPNRFQHVDTLLDHPGPSTDPNFIGSEAVQCFLCEDSKVLIISTGGLGCEILANLALMGFADIHVIDMDTADTIDISNLNQQFLFRPKDVGKPKVIVTAEFIMSHIPGTKVAPYLCPDTYFGKIQDKPESYYMQFNLIVCRLDNSVKARRWMNATPVAMVNPDMPESLKLMIDSGTEGLKGQARVILPSIMSCYECSLDMLNKQTVFPICTIVNTPRLLEHCIKWVSMLEWPKVFPDKKLNTDDLEHIQWLFMHTSTHTHEFKIEGITWSLTQGIVKNIIPTIMSTNVVIAASCCTEAFKLMTNCAPRLDNYFMLIGEMIDMPVKKEWMLERLIRALVERQDIQAKKPSLSVNGCSLYLQAPLQLECATCPNLEKKLVNLVNVGDELMVMAGLLPFNLTPRVLLKD